jgi:hypothetical protein
VPATKTSVTATVRRRRRGMRMDRKARPVIRNTTVMITATIIVGASLYLGECVRERRERGERRENR